MEPVYWYVGAYIVGSAMGFIFGRQAGVSHGILLTLVTLIEDGYLKHKIKSNGELDIIQLTFEEKLNGETPESKDS